MKIIPHFFSLTSIILTLLAFSPLAEAAAGAQCGKNTEATVLGIHVSGGEHWCRCTFDSGNWILLEFPSRRSRELFAELCNNTVAIMRQRDTLKDEKENLQRRNTSLQTDLTRCQRNATSCAETVVALGDQYEENLESTESELSGCYEAVCEAISYIPSRSLGAKVRDSYDILRQRFDCPEEVLPSIEGVNLMPTPVDSSVLKKQ